MERMFRSTERMIRYQVMQEEAHRRDGFQSETSNAAEQKKGADYMPFYFLSVMLLEESAKLLDWDLFNFPCFSA